MRFKIEVRSHGFSVSVLYAYDKRILSDFCSSLEVYNTRFDPRSKRTIRELQMTFATFYPKTDTYGLHIGLYDSFKVHLVRYGVAENDIETTFLDMCYPVAKSNLVLSKEAIPRDYQEPILKYINSDDKIRVLALQTGKGKTAVSLFNIVKLGIRTAVILEAALVEIWIKDISWMYKDYKKEVLIIKGNEAFKSLIATAKEVEITQSIIIFTTRTMGDYLKEYETDGESSYGCNPKELYPLLQVGYKIVDEAHSNLHFHFRHDIHTHVKQSLYLSATLSSHAPVINRMYLTIFPLAFRYVGLEWDKYIVVTAIAYQVNDVRNLKCSGTMGYSHAEFEKSILKNRTRSNNYLKMLTYFVKDRFLKKNLNGQKLLIYASTVDMCAIMASYLRLQLSEYNLKIHDYNGEHEDEVLHNNDIVITTPKKSGKGKDVKKLSTVISTVAVNAKELNTQMLGRLRRTDEHYPGYDPEFIYLFAVNVQKHADYHKTKIDIYRPLTKSIMIYRSQFMV